MLRALLDRAPLVRIDPRADPMRCWCAACQRLDRLFPAEGYQLALFPLSPIERATAEAIEARRTKRGRP